MEQPIQPQPQQPVQPTPQPSVLGRVSRYKVFEGPIALIWLGYLAIAAAWIAFVYLAIPRIWEWATEGVIPFSQSGTAPYQGYLAWGFAGLLLLGGFVVLPLTRVFGIREVAFTERGIAFRDRVGREKTVISRLAAVKSKRRMTMLQGWNTRGNKVRQVVAQNRLGKEQYQAFQEQLEELLAAGHLGS